MRTNISWKKVPINLEECYHPGGNSRSSSVVSAVWSFCLMNWTWSPSKKNEDLSERRIESCGSKLRDPQIASAILDAHMERLQDDP